MYLLLYGLYVYAATQKKKTYYIFVIASFSSQQMPAHATLSHSHFGWFSFTAPRSLQSHPGLHAFLFGSLHSPRSSWQLLPI